MEISSSILVGNKGEELLGTETGSSAWECLVTLNFLGLGGGGVTFVPVVFIIKLFSIYCLMVTIMGNLLVLGKGSRNIRKECDKGRSDEIIVLECVQRYASGITAGK